MARFKGLKYAIFIGGLVTAIGLACYPIIIYPMTHIDEYKEIQKKNRQGVNQEAVQPGNMKVWTDPFDRQKE